jgi:hypothetical protein
MMSAQEKTCQKVYQEKHPQGVIICIGFFLSALLILMAGCSSSHIPEIEIYPSVKLRPNIRFRTSPSKETVERLLAEIWLSGFLEKTESVRREILNNSYGIFCQQNELSSGCGVKAYFLRETGQNDRVMLSRGLFSGFQLDPSLGVCRRHMYAGAQATIVHELFHDFWFNLLDEEQRERFRREALDLFRAGRAATTVTAKLDFLSRMGVKEPRTTDFVPYAEIMAYHEDYSEERYFGTEMFALVAEMAYSGDIKIPASLIPFYEGILSPQALTDVSKSMQTP